MAKCHWVDKHRIDNVQPKLDARLDRMRVSPGMLGRSSGSQTQQLIIFSQILFDAVTSC